MPARTHYISDRMLPDAIRSACDKRGITVTSFSDDWILKLQKDQQEEWIHVYSFSCNNAAAAANASDKVATSVILESAALPIVPHVTARTYISRARRTPDIKAIANNGPVVIKPIHGHGAQDVARYDDIDEALTFINASSIPAWAISPFLDLTKELRIILFDDEPLLAYEKTNPVIDDGLRLFNLSQGATAVTVDLNSLDPAILDLAKRAISTIGLRLAAVDIVFDKESEPFILEINTGFSLEHYARQSADNKKRAYKIYDSVIGKIFK
ncbi:hypothetical protein CYG49_02365 [Candidatus Saccharibacteria bacterium]|nr:MAG: hypothetical protein CYG49_02365 [Candidatus Saccharibacteria bacterium]